MTSARASLAHSDRLRLARLSRSLANAAAQVALLSPFLVLILGFLIVPVAIFSGYAFQDGLAGWIGVARSPGTVASILRTLSISFQVTAICGVLAYVYVASLTNSSPRVRAILLYSVLIPFFTSVLVRTYSWIMILSNNGLVGSLLDALGADATSVDLLYNRPGVLIGMVHVLLPLFILPLYSVAAKIPQGLVPAARTLGASRIDAFLGVYLPLTMPGAAAGAVLVFITSLGFYITPSLLGGSHDVMVAQAIDRQFSVSGDLSVAAALSVLMVLAVFVALILLRTMFPIEVLFLPERSEYRKRRTTASRESRLRRSFAQLRRQALRLLDDLPWGAITVGGTWTVVLFFLLPLVVVIPVAFSGDPFLQFPPSSYSLRWISQVISDPLWTSAAINSLVIGGLAVLAAGLAGIPAAFSLSRGQYGRPLKGALLLLSIVPLLIPIMVLAVALFIWYLELGLIGSVPALAASHALLGLPFVVVIVAAGLRDFDVRLEQAARTLGAGPFNALRHVTFPILTPAFAAGLLFAFLMSFDELLIARGVARLDSETLPIRLWNGASDEISPALAVVSTLSMSLTTGALVLTRLIGRSRRGLRRAGSGSPRSE